MPKAKKLPSGSWRCQIMIDGKRQSITVDDPSPSGRRECERRAAEAAVIRRIQKSSPLKVVIQDYIDERDGALSVTTIRSYRGLLANAYDSIADIPVSLLEDSDIQKWINKYKLSHSPKTCKNAYGLLCSAVNHSFNVKLPSAVPIEYYTPTDADIQKILKFTEGTDMEKAILLSAFGTLREGEVCALTLSDIKKDHIVVSKSFAWDGSNYVLKAPKTVSSVRTVNLPPNVLKRLRSGLTRSEERIVYYMPRQLSLQFTRMLKKAEMPPFRFHDLRAYSASIRHAMGIPDQYIMMDGGWKTDTVLKKVYRRALEDKRKEFSQISDVHFSSFIS